MFEVKLAPGPMPDDAVISLLLPGLLPPPLYAFLPGPEQYPEPQLQMAQSGIRDRSANPTDDCNLLCRSCKREGGMARKVHSSLATS